MPQGSMLVGEPCESSGVSHVTLVRVFQETLIYQRNSFGWGEVGGTAKAFADSLNGLLAVKM